MSLYERYMGEIFKELAYERHLDELAKSDSWTDRVFVEMKREHEAYPRFFGHPLVLHRGSRADVLVSAANPS